MMVRFIARAALLTLMMALTAIVTRVCLRSGPRWIYQGRTHSLRSACAKLRSGMILPEVEARLGATAHYNELLAGDQLQFEGDGACEVELDPLTRKVVASKFRENTLDGAE